MVVDCTWRRHEYAKLEKLEMEDEDLSILEDLKKWWNEKGEAWTNEYYGIKESGNTGDLVIENIDEFMEENMFNLEDDIKSEDDEEMYPEEVRIQLEKELKEEEERIKEQESDNFFLDDEEEDEDDDDYDW